MNYVWKTISVTFLIAILFSSPIAQADRNDSIKALFTWAEQNYPHLFSSSGVNLQTYQIWTYNYYPATNTYAGVNTNDEVWVLGDVFGGMLYINTLENLLNVIGYEESSANGTGSNGSGSCVNVPQVSNGSRIVSENIGLGTVSDRTYSNVSATQFTILDITTSALLNSQVESLMTVDFSVTNNVAYLHSLTGTITSESSLTGTQSFSSTTEYNPALSRGPFYVLCQGDTWTEPSITMTTKLDGQVISSEATQNAQGIVNSVSEVITVPAGQFTTVKKTTTDPLTIHIDWIDINTGHIVKIEEYDNDGATPTLRWTSQATLVE